MKKFITPILLILILTGGFVFRLYKIRNPIADWHSWRQADTAAVARNFIKEQFNILYPQSDSLLALSEHQLPNPNRYFINEFPLYNAIVALLYKSTGINVVVARLVSVIFSTFGALFLFLLTRKLFDTKNALLATFYYEFMPYNVYYNRVTMPDPAFVALGIISLYFCVKFVETKSVFQTLLFAFFFALAMLVKPYAIFLGLPIAYWILVNWKSQVIKTKSLVLMGLAATSVIPLLLWRWHIHLHPEGAFASNWLLNEGNIRFTGAFFRWIIFERFNRIIFATGGFVLFVMGIAASIKSKNASFVFVWLMSIFIYIIVFAKGNVTHDYYQLPLVPVGAILVSVGFWELIKNGKTIYQKSINTLLAISLIVISLAFGWFEVRGFYQINHPEIVEAGTEADKILPPNAVVIAPYDTDPAFLYQTNRIGWPIGYDVPKKIEQGATAYVSVNFDDETNAMAKQYTVLKKTDKYVIIDLTKPVILKTKP